MSRNAFACIASLFKAGLDRRARCSDGGEQDKSYRGKTRETGERAREPPFCLFSLLSFFFSFHQLFARALNTYLNTWNKLMHTNYIEFSFYCRTCWSRETIGPLQLAIHVAQNRHAGMQKSHWGKTNKRHT